MIYFGFDKDGRPIRISREDACKIYKAISGRDTDSINRILDGGPDYYSDDSGHICLMVCNMDMGNAYVYIDGNFIAVSEL